MPEWSRVLCGSQSNKFLGKFFVKYSKICTTITWYHFGTLCAKHFCNYLTLVYTANVCNPACDANAYCGTDGGTDCTCNAGYNGDGQTAGTGCTGMVVIQF